MMIKIKILLELASLVESVRVPMTMPSDLVGVSDVETLDQDLMPGTLGVARQVVNLKGSPNYCYSANITVAGQSYRVKLDTGSADTVLPGRSGIYNYAGPIVENSIPDGATEVTANYADKSYWVGKLNLLNVGLTGTKITALAPIFLMTNQSSNPLFINSSINNGLMGLAYGRIGHYGSDLGLPLTVLDAWSNHMSMPNKATFHACSYDQANDSYVEFGAPSTYTACRLENATVFMPQRSYLTVQLDKITTGGTDLGFSAQSYSTLVDSCSTKIHLPSDVLTLFKAKIKQSGGLSALSSTAIDNFLAGSIVITNNAIIAYSLLPPISFRLVSGGRDEYTTVTLTIGPMQYIQKDDSGFSFGMSATTSSWVSLGIPFFTGYHMTFDRSAASINFKPGCACANSDGYPTIIKGTEAVTWNGTTSASSRPDSVPLRQLTLYILFLATAFF